MQLKGTITALITPFKDQQIDEKSLVSLIQRQIAAGVDGLLLLGITGECCTLTEAEQEKVIKVGVKEIAGRIPLIIGTGSSSTQLVIERTLKAKEYGADAALVVTPYFNKPTQEGIYRHFKAITEAVDLALIVYNHPGRVIVPIEIPTLLRIAELPHIIAIKDAADHLSQAGDLIYALKDKFPHLLIFSADDISTYPLMALGAVGVISALSNLVPEKIVKLVKMLAEKDFKNALELHYELFPLFKAAFLETNPIPIKTAMNLCGIDAGHLRLPLCEMNADHLKRLINVLKKMKLIAHEKS